MRDDHHEEEMHLPAIRPPIHVWLDESEDQPLVAELRALIEEDGHLGELIAAGALSRYERTVRDEAARAAFLSGVSRGDLPPRDPQRDWASDLPMIEREELLAYALVLCAWLAGELEAGGAMIVFRAGIRQLRDDIESLRALLSVHPLVAKLDERIEDIDALATRCFIDHGAFTPWRAPSVRLARAAIQYPEGWWSSSPETRAAYFY